MNWLEEFHACLIQDFGWTPPTSSDELEARLNSVRASLPVPDTLWAYASGYRQFESDYDEGVWSTMRHNLNHQGSVGPETALAIHFVVQIARHLQNAPRTDLLGDVLWFGTGDQSWHLPYGWPLFDKERDDSDDRYHGRSCYRALEREAHILREIAAGDDLNAQAMALWVLSFVPQDAENVAIMRARWNDENSDIRRLAMISLAKLGAEMTPSELHDLQAGFTSADERLRSTCALALATTQLVKDEWPTDNTLRQICELRDMQKAMFDVDIEFDLDGFACGIWEECCEKDEERAEAICPDWN